MSQNNETEQTILEKRNYGLDTNAPISAPLPSYDPDDATFRLFCSNLGLNSLANWNNLVPFAPEFDSSDNISRFQSIDKLPGYVLSIGQMEC